MKEECIVYHRDKDVIFPPRPWLDEKEYFKACSVFVRVTVDVFLFNQKEKTIYLARRIIPIEGWMGLGGMVDPGENFREAAVRVVKKDSMLEISPEKLNLLVFFRCIYNANGNPIDSFGIQFSYNIEPEYLRNICLKSEEYSCESIRSFNKERLKKERSSLHPGVEEVFKRIFPN